MCYFLLLPSGKVISRTTVTAVTPKELEDLEVKADIAKFDRDVSNRIDGVQGQQLTGDWHGTKQDLDLIYADEEPVMYMEDLPEGPQPAIESDLKLMTIHQRHLTICYLLRCNYLLEEK